VNPLVSPFAAGQDELHQFLADREAKQIRDQQLARQAQLDQQNEAYRQSELGLRGQDMDLRRQEFGEREQDRQAGVAIRQDTQRRADAAEKEVHDALNTFTDPNASPQDRQKAAFTLDQHHVSPTLLNPKPTTKPTLFVGADGTTRQGPTVDANTEVIHLPKPEAAPKPPKDNPNLPQGVVNYLDDFLTKTKGVDAKGNPAPYSLNDAYQEVSQNWGKLKAVHPGLDAGAVKAYMMKSFPQDPLTGQRQGFAMGGGAPGITPKPQANATPSGVGVPGANPPPPGSPGERADQVSKLLANVPGGKVTTLSDGTKWLKLPNGSVSQVQ
jgi:hypothetical protein